MGSEEKSLWARKRSGWYRDAARTEIVERFSRLLQVFVVLGLILIIYGWMNRETPLGWAALAGAPLCGAAALGFWSGQDWARLVGGAAAVLLAAFPLVSLVVFREPSLDWLIGTVFLASVCVPISVFLLGAKGRKLFKQARVGVEDEEPG